MTALISSILNKAIPAYTAYQMLEKKGPKNIKNFSKLAIGAGFTADEVIGYLRNHFDSPAQKDEREYLKERSKSGMARPEESLRSSQLQNEESNKDLMQKFASLGIGAAGGVAGMGSTAVGQMLGGGQPQEEKHAAGEVIEVTEDLETPEEAQSSGNPIRDTFPDLADKVEAAIQQQGNPLAAAEFLKSTGQHGIPIGVLEKRSGMSFPDLVAQIYGGQQASQDQAQSQQSAGQGQNNQQGITKEQMIQAAQKATEGVKGIRNFFNK